MHESFSSRTRYLTAIYCKIVRINVQIYSILVDVTSFSAHNLHNCTIQSGNEHLVPPYYIYVTHFAGYFPNIYHPI